MKKLVVTFLLILAFSGTGFSQRLYRSEYDSLWAFKWLGADIVAGTWMPAGKLSEHFGPSFQFGLNANIGFNDRLRLHYLLMPRVLNQRQAFGIKVQDSIVSAETNFGMSVGGAFSYSVVQNKYISSELFAGVTWECITTDIPNQDRRRRNDSLINISGIGITCGLNTWIRTIGRQNFAIRTTYTYATYNNSRHLAGPLGGHAFTLALVYRFPRRHSFE